MAVKISMNFDEKTANILEKLAKEMGIIDEEVIKIAIKLYRQKKITIKERNKRR